MKAKRVRYYHDVQLIGEQHCSFSRQIKYNNAKITLTSIAQYKMNTVINNNKTIYLHQSLIEFKLLNPLNVPARIILHSL